MVSLTFSMLVEVKADVYVADILIDGLDKVFKSE